MSTGDPPATPPASPAPVLMKVAPASQPGQSKEIRIVSHSNLFYWWPVWAIGYLMAIDRKSTRLNSSHG